MRHLESVCPECSQVNIVEHKGEKLVHVNCAHCPEKYEHVVLTQNTASEEQKKMKQVQEMVVKKRIAQMSDRSVVCLIVLNNGYEVEGRATVKDPKDFNIAIGEQIAYEKALKRAILALGSSLE